MLIIFCTSLFKKDVMILNPLKDVLRKRVKKNAIKPSKLKRIPFTSTEITMILKAFKEDKYCACTNYKHSFYYPFLYFIFRTGVRNGEAVGLLVKHIHVERNLIEISESLSRTIKGYNAANRVRKETKNDKV